MPVIFSASLAKALKHKKAHKAQPHAKDKPAPAKAKPHHARVTRARSRLP